MRLPTYLGSASRISLRVVGSAACVCLSTKYSTMYSKREKEIKQRQDFANLSTILPTSSLYVERQHLSRIAIPAYLGLRQFMIMGMKTGQ